jgi:hypothetical protein
MLYPQAKTDYQNRIAYQSGKYEGVRLENNTRLVQRHPHGIECYAVKLHNTDVVTYFPNGLVMLKTGGWETVTTKRRINKYHDGPRIYQEDYIWYIDGTRYSKAISERDLSGKPVFRSYRVYVMNGEIVKPGKNGILDQIR